MIDVVCILFQPEGKGLPQFSTGYSAQWVDKLARGIQRNTSHDYYQFICLVDQFYEFEEDIDQVEIEGCESGMAM